MNPQNCWLKTKILLHIFPVNTRSLLILIFIVSFGCHLLVNKVVVKITVRVNQTLLNEVSLMTRTLYTVEL